MNLREPVSQLVHFFRENRLDFALAGAFALQAHGYTRATRDADFVVRASSQAPLITFLESLGFETLNRSEGYSNHLHTVGTIRFDFLYLDPGTAGQIFSQVLHKSVFGGLELPVVSAAHLVAMKLHAARNDARRKMREFADIRELVKAGAISDTGARALFQRYGWESEYE